MDSKSNLLINDLQLNLKGDVYSDPGILGIYSTDASIYQINPIAVVAPRDESDVKFAIKICHDHKTAILPRGGGTSLAGQAVGKAVVIDFSKYLNKIIEINPDQQYAWIQPGVTRDQLNRELAIHQLQFAPDPATSSRANFGGMVGNNSAGTKSILYGKTVDHLLAMEIVLEDGTELLLEEHSPSEFNKKAEDKTREGVIYQKIKEIIEQNQILIEEKYPKVMRRVQGYNLDEFKIGKPWNIAKLICGSEGTLATMLRIKVNLTPLPKAKSVCAVHFHEMSDAIKAVNVMLKYNPAAIEIIDRTVLQMSKKNLETRKYSHFIEGDPAAIQIVEFYGEEPSEMKSRAQKMKEDLAASDLGYAFPYFEEGPTYHDVWAIRKKGLGLMLGMKTKKKPIAFIEDAAIPTEVLPEYIEEVVDLCHSHQTEAAVYAHASVGVIHVRPILDLREQEDIDRFKAIAEGAFKLIKKYGGSLSGEHGDGLVRSPFLEEYFGPELYNAFREVKQIFDPLSLMNPGKIVDPAPIDHNLRYGVTYQDKEVKTYYQYRDDGSYAEAIHMCSGVGECRKTSGGTMCPSYRATMDENDSTRGRANTLRLAMSGQLGTEELYSEDVHKSLDLCLSCKACKAECPSSVDMAKLKSETLQMRYELQGLNFRDRMIRGSVKAARQFAGHPARFINLVQGSIPFRWGLEKIGGFDRRRILPSYSNFVFEDWYKKNYKPTENATGMVALFADSYINYYEPHLGINAIRLLQKLNLEVVLAKGCCQRPLISHGFLKDAISRSQTTIENLKSFFTKDIPVLVIEPGCASAFNDDLADLQESDWMSDQLKAKVINFESYLNTYITEKLKIPIKTKKSKYLFHGHCHQKALYGTDDTKSLIQKLTNTSLDEIPSGCCGMAGSFGYEKEHYEVSKKVGEDTLFRAINSAQDDTGILASGFSCRHQIDHFTNHKPTHWLEMLDFD